MAHCENNTSKAYLFDVLFGGGGGRDRDQLKFSKAIVRPAANLQILFLIFLFGLFWLPWGVFVSFFSISNVSSLLSFPFRFRFFCNAQFCFAFRFVFVFHVVCQNNSPKKKRSISLPPFETKKKRFFSVLTFLSPRRQNKKYFRKFCDPHTHPPVKTETKLEMEKKEAKKRWKC